MIYQCTVLLFIFQDYLTKISKKCLLHLKKCIFDNINEVFCLLIVILISFNHPIDDELT